MKKLHNSNDSDYLYCQKCQNMYNKFLKNFKDAAKPCQSAL